MNLLHVPIYVDLKHTLLKHTYMCNSIYMYIYGRKNTHQIHDSGFLGGRRGRGRGEDQELGGE